MKLIAPLASRVDLNSSKHKCLGKRLKSTLKELSNLASILAAVLEETKLSKAMSFIESFLVRSLKIDFLS